MNLRGIFGAGLDALLGPRCDLGCGERVFPKDEEWHRDREHAGDQYAEHAEEWPEGAR